MDSVHGQLVAGRKIRILTIIDTFSRFSLATDPRFSYRGEDVVQTLERVCRQHGYPKTIRVGQGSEFISSDLDVDVPEKCRARLLQARKTDQQRIHRKLQRQVPRLVPQYALVHEP